MTTPLGNVSCGLPVRAADVVAEVGELEDELVQPRPAKHPVVIHVDRVEGVGAVAPVLGHVASCRRRTAASWCCGRSAPTGTAAGSARRHLAGQQVLAVRRRIDAVEAREQPLRVDRLRRVLLRPLGGDEVVGLVLDDRPAEGAAELVAAVVLLGDVAFSLSVSVSAFIDLSRNTVNQLPCGLLVPLLVTMFITPPLLRPYSAL